VISPDTILGWQFTREDRPARFVAADLAGLSAPADPRTREAAAVYANRPSRRLPGPGFVAQRPGRPA
jgi:hypothetical protein